MKTKVIIPLLATALLSGCLFSCNKNPTNNGEPQAIVLPDAFKGRNFANAAVTYFGGGVALIFDNNLTPEIQNISYHVEMYDVTFEARPITKKNNMYFLPFKVTDQVIDDGYLKNNTEYKFWLSYENSTYYCGVSLNDETLTEPEATLMEGTL